MKNYYLFFILSVFFISLAVAGSSIISSEKSGSKANFKVMESLENEGKARVIVVMKNTGNEKENRKIIAAASEKIEDEKIKHKFSSFNGFSATLTAEEISALENDANVESISYDSPVHAFLQESAPLINATLAWPLQTSGLNLTGKGQTVCIIDSGINYTHPDLGGCNLQVYETNGSIENLTTPVQSEHNYSNNFDYTWNISMPGYSKIAVHFVNISLEYPGQSGYDSADRVIIYNSQKQEIARYHGIDGEIIDLWTPFSTGNTIYIRLVTDSGVRDYGFYIDSVMNGTTNTTYNWSACSKSLNGWDFVNNEGDPFDDNGHGTHVAGIAAAKGSIQGIAFEANIVSAKALDSDGGGYSSDIISAIEFCTNRSFDLNISVISMSLGGDINHTSYCDSYIDDASDLFAAAINNAVANNISVVVAAGNNKNFTGISSPACIQNATPVSASNNDDSIPAYSNRNNLVQLFAPGSNINSTNLTNGYATISGTSMATPHVSAAIAILNQYLKSNGKSKTPAELESVLNRTGKKIYDSSSGLNFSRINVYSALMWIDSSSPNVTLSYPMNNGVDESENQTFRCNASDWQMANLTLYVWNSTGNLSFENRTSNVYGTQNYSEFNLTNMPEGTYYWNCLACDNAGEKSNCAFMSSDFTFTIGKINTLLNSPPDNSKVGAARQNQTFNCSARTADDLSLKNITFFIWNSSGSLISSQSNNFSGILNYSLFNYNFSLEGNYFWNCLAYDNTSSSSSALSNNSIAYDTTSPTLSVISPSNLSWYNAYRFNVTLNEAGNSCWHSLNHGSNVSMLNSSLTKFYYTATASETSTNSQNNVTIYCNDTAGNINSSSIVFFGVDKSAPTVDLTGPANNYETSSTSQSFTYTVSDLTSISKCILFVDNSAQQTDSSITKSTSQSFSISLSTGSHTWKVNCTDEVGYTGVSSSRTITIVSTSSNNGGNSGGTTNTRTTVIRTNSSSNLSISSNSSRNSFSTLDSEGSYIPSEEDLKNKSGYLIILKKGEKIIFSLEKEILFNDVNSTNTTFSIINETHTLTIADIQNDSVNITIQSEPIKIFLKTGEERKLNLSSAGYYDLYLKLNSIENSSANLTIKIIHEPIYGYAKKLLKFFSGIKISIAKYRLWILIVLGVIILILVNDLITYYLLKRRQQMIKTPEFSRYEDHHKTKIVKLHQK